MITVEVSPDSIAVDIDEDARAVFLSEVPMDLEQVGIAIGTVCTAINEQPAYDFLAESGLSCGEALQWDFVVGGRSIRLLLILKDDVTASVPTIAQTPASDAAAVTSADFDDHRSEAWDSVEPDLAPNPVIDAPLFVRPPVCLNLPEYPVGDSQHKRERRPNYTAIQNWRGWGREPKEW